MAIKQQRVAERELSRASVRSPVKSLIDRLLAGLTNSEARRPARLRCISNSGALLMTSTDFPLCGSPP
jgi:hypothetical protein